MLIKLLHRLAAHPWAYDQIQNIVGVKRVLDRLSQGIAPLHPKTVVDIGGGTGAIHDLLASDCLYICLDIELPKLAGFRSRVPSGLAILGDATSMPIIGCCADMVICKSVTHHFSDLMLERALDESRRVLRTGGHIVLLDAVVNRQRLAGRILWKLDRGSYPRTDEELRKKMEGKFQLVHWEKFAIYHEYVLGIGVRRQ
jgi:ubiquinone/menaquinone biosynthesis C-methylase UbiE